MPLLKKICFVSCLLLISNSVCYAEQVEDTEITSTLHTLNVARRAAGLDTVSLSHDLSVGCYNHAKYLALNKNNPLTVGLSAHKEFVKLAGYTPSGEIAGKSSVIHYVKPTEAITGWMKTFYHRIPLLQPNLKEVGIGYYQQGEVVISLIDCISGNNGEGEKDVVYCPADSQISVPVDMGGEIPNPVGKDGSYGYPITIYFSKEQKITEVVFKMYGADNHYVECFVSSPQNPATFFEQWNTICAIPKKTLNEGALYRVNLSCKVNGVLFKKQYSFTTTKIP